ncbi:MAG: hypothetical protein D6730_07240 [Bacteroidetes bacterium]|nr:MAG: hypothetical protein D6730_07240 [Bacteroidota bacterium]
MASIVSNLTFEELLPFFQIQGGATVCLTENLAAPGPGTGFPPATPTNIIKTSQGWSVAFQWETLGALTNLMAGQFQLNLFLEEMGSGEYALPAAFSTATVNFVSAPNVYNQVMNIPANQVPAGVYKLVVSLTFKGPLGVPGPIAAFSEVGMIQFYDSI